MFRIFLIKNVEKNILKRSQPIVIPKRGVALEEAKVKFKRPFEMNDVKLMGTIVNEVQKLTNGAIRLHLKTINEDASYCVHKVSVTSHSLIQMTNKWEIGQRVFVCGRLKTEAVEIGNEFHYKAEIMAGQLYNLEPSYLKITDTLDSTEMRPTLTDQNSIEVFSLIHSQILQTGDLFSFELVNHFIKKKGTADESEEAQYHQVIIDDKNLIEKAKRLSKNDKVYINGFINYATRKFSDGNEYVNGFIHPTSIVKFKKFGIGHVSHIKANLSGNSLFKYV